MINLEREGFFMKKFKQLTSLLVAFVLCLSLVPTTAFGEYASGADNVTVKYVTVNQDEDPTEEFVIETEFFPDFCTIVYISGSGNYEINTDYSGQTLLIDGVNVTVGKNGNVSTDTLTIIGGGSLTVGGATFTQAHSLTMPTEYDEVGNIEAVAYTQVSKECYVSGTVGNGEYLHFGYATVKQDTTLTIENGGTVEISAYGYLGTEAGYQTTATGEINAEQGAKLIANHGSNCSVDLYDDQGNSVLNTNKSKPDLYAETMVIGPFEHIEAFEMKEANGLKWVNVPMDGDGLNPLQFTALYQCSDAPRLSMVLDSTTIVPFVNGERRWFKETPCFMPSWYDENVEELGFVYDKMTFEIADNPVVEDEDAHTKPYRVDIVTYDQFNTLFSTDTEAIVANNVISIEQDNLALYQIDIDDNNRFTFTPIGNAPFEIRIYWTEDDYNFSNFTSTATYPYYVEFHWNNNGTATLNTTGLSGLNFETVTFGNTTKVHAKSSVGSLTFDLSPKEGEFIDGIRIEQEASEGNEDGFVNLDTDNRYDAENSTFKIYLTDSRYNEEREGYKFVNVNFDFSMNVPDNFLFYFEYDDCEGNASVQRANDNYIFNNKAVQEFHKNGEDYETVSFTLNPPAGNVGTPVVEVEVFDGEDETPNTHDILTANQGVYSFTPEKDNGFIIRVWWSEEACAYEGFNMPYMVEFESNDEGSVSVSATDQVSYNGHTKVGWTEAPETVSFTVTPDTNKSLVNVWIEQEADGDGYNALGNPESAYQNGVLDYSAFHDANGGFVLLRFDFGDWDNNAPYYSNYWFDYDGRNNAAVTNVAGTTTYPNRWDDQNYDGPYTFTAGQAIQFKLTPPDDEGTYSPVVVAEVYDGDDQNPNTMTNLVAASGVYSFTPSKNNGVVFRVWWSQAEKDYNDLQPGDGEISIEINSFSNTATVTDSDSILANVAGDKKISLGEKTKYILPDTVTSLNLTITPGQNEVLNSIAVGSDNITEFTPKQDGSVDYTWNIGNDNRYMELHFSNQGGGDPQTDELGIVFPEGTEVSGNVATVPVNETVSVTVTVSGADIEYDDVADRYRVAVPQDDADSVTFTLGNTFTEGMRVELHGSGGFGTTLNVTDFVTDLTCVGQGVHLNGWLNFEIREGGNEPEPGDRPIRPNDDELNVFFNLPQLGDGDTAPMVEVAVGTGDAGTIDSNALTSVAGANTVDLYIKPKANGGNLGSFYGLRITTVGENEEADVITRVYNHSVPDPIDNEYVDMDQKSTASPAAITWDGMKGMYKCTITRDSSAGILVEILWENDSVVPEDGNFSLLWDLRSNNDKTLFDDEVVSYKIGDNAAVNVNCSNENTFESGEIATGDDFTLNIKPRYFKGNGEEYPARYCEFFGLVVTTFDENGHESENYILYSDAEACPIKFNSDTGVYTYTMTRGDTDNSSFAVRILWEKIWYTVSYGMSGNIRTENGDVTVDRIHIGDKIYTNIATEVNESNDIYSLDLLADGNSDTYSENYKAADDKMLQYGFSYSNGDIFFPIFTGGDSKIDYRITPDYGYQIKSIDANDVDLMEDFDPQEGVSCYQFTVRENGNVHFIVTFEQTQNTVTKNTTGVSSASITNGANAATAGTLSLTVDDTATAGFSGALDSLNLTLDNIVSKGGDRGNWTSNLTSFDDEIDVTLTLDTGVYGDDDYAVIREHTDGNVTTTEEIGASYNNETGELTFGTNKFSTYTIVKVANAAKKSGDTVNVTAVTKTSASIILVASYDANGRMISCQTQTAGANAKVAMFSLANSANAASVRIFYLNSNYVPVDVTETINSL